MASPEQTIYLGIPSESAEIVEMPVAAELVMCDSIEGEPQEASPVKERLREYAQRTAEIAGQAVNTTRRTANRVYHQARDRARTGYTQLSQSSQEWTRIAKANAVVAKRDYPLQTLGVIAGAAFLCGVGLRIWRSRNS